MSLEHRDYILLSEEAEVRILARGNAVRFVDILRAVASESGQTPALLLGPRRNRDVAWPRHLVMLIARRLCPMLSFPRIGQMLGGRDHTTILDGCKKAEMRLKEFPHYRQQYEAVMRRLGADSEAAE